MLLTSVRNLPPRCSLPTRATEPGPLQLLPEPGYDEIDAARVRPQSCVWSVRPNGTSFRAKVSKVTHLSARTFGVWTLTAAVVRYYAAYNLHDPQSVGFHLFCLPLTLAQVVQPGHRDLHHRCGPLHGRAALLPDLQAGRALPVAFRRWRWVQGCFSARC
jgi:hypothetical protein